MPNHAKPNTVTLQNGNPETHNPSWQKVSDAKGQYFVMDEIPATKSGIDETLERLALKKEAHPYAYLQTRCLNKGTFEVREFGNLYSGLFDFSNPPYLHEEDTAHTDHDGLALETVMGNYRYLLNYAWDATRNNLAIHNPEDARMKEKFSEHTSGIHGDEPMNISQVLGSLPLYTPKTFAVEGNVSLNDLVCQSQLNKDLPVIKTVRRK